MCAVIEAEFDRRRDVIWHVLDEFWTVSVRLALIFALVLGCEFPFYRSPSLYFTNLTGRQLLMLTTSVKY